MDTLTVLAWMTFLAFTASLDAPTFPAIVDLVIGKATEDVSGDLEEKPRVSRQLFQEDIPRHRPLVADPMEQYKSEELHYHHHTYSVSPPISVTLGQPVTVDLTGGYPFTSGLTYGVSTRGTYSWFSPYSSLLGWRR